MNWFPFSFDCECVFFKCFFWFESATDFHAAGMLVVVVVAICACRFDPLVAASSASSSSKQPRTHQ